MSTGFAEGLRSALRGLITVAGLIGWLDQQGLLDGRKLLDHPLQAGAAIIAALVIKGICKGASLSLSDRR